MDYLVLSSTSAVLFFLSILSGGTSSVNMCTNGSTSINADNLKLDAFGPPISPLTTNTSITCSCYITMTSYLSDVTVQISRDTNSVLGCQENQYDEATLEPETLPIKQPLTLQNDDLSNYYGEYNYMSTITFSISINSICGSNYTIQLEETSLKIPYIRNAQFSQVTCSHPKTVVSSSSTTASPNSMKPEGVSTNYMSSTYLAKRNSTADSVFENNTPAPLPIGLIIGVVVGVGGGLLIIGAIVSVIFIFRRRRAKPKPLTYANLNAPTEPHAYEGLSNSTQLQTGVLYDNQSAASDPLATESDHAYYNVQGIDNSAFNHSDAVSNHNQTSSEELYYSVQEPHSVNDTDTTVVENDLYEKNNTDTTVIENDLYENNNTNTTVIENDLYEK